MKVVLGTLALSALLAVAALVGIGEEPVPMPDEGINQVAHSVSYSCEGTGISSNRPIECADGQMLRHDIYLSPNMD